MENMQNNMGGGMKKTCSCTHHKVIPVLVVLFGLTFLLGALNVFTPGFVAIVWPVIVIIGGLVKLTSKMCKCC